MSTAGKVLVVLVTLALMAWIVLFSAVAQLNANWGQKIVKQESELEDLQAKIDKLAIQVDETHAASTLKQVELTKEVVVLRSRVADGEKVLSESNETNSRYQFNLQTAQVAEKDAQDTRERRDRDLAELKTQRSALEDEVRRSRQENGVLLGRFDQLQKDFLKTSAENKELARRVVGGVRRTSR